MEDWELLQDSELALLSSPKSTGYYNSCDSTIRSDYFAVGSEKSSGEDGLLLDPNLISEGLGEAKGELGFGGNGLSSKNLDGFWSDESSDGRVSEKEGLGDAGELEMEVRCEEIEAWDRDLGVENGRRSVQYSQDVEVVSEEIEANWKPSIEEESLNGNKLLLDGCKEVIVVQRDSITDEEVNLNEIELGLQDAGGLDGVGDAGIGGIGQTEEIEMSNENSKELGAGELVRMEGTAIENEGSKNVCIGGGEKKEVVWWKMPLELLKFCAFRVRPVWSISITAAILGLMMLGKRLYRMKHKSRSIPLKIAIDDKKASQLMVHAAKLNEAFSVVRRVPVIRSSIPVGGATPWPMLPLR